MTNQDARWIQAALILALGIVAAGAAGPWITRIRMGIDPSWFYTAAALAIVCLATGGLGAWQVRAGRSILPQIFIWLLICAVGAYIAVGISLVGGPGIAGDAAAWNIGFWIVTAVGWVPAYLFFFGYFALFFSLSPSRNQEFSHGSSADILMAPDSEPNDERAR